MDKLGQYFGWRVFWLVGFSSLAACKHPSGVASFQVIESQHAPPPTDARELRLEVARSVFVDAKAIEPLAVPVYPPEALSAHLGTVTIAVRVLVGKDGRVAVVGPSMAGLSLPTRFSERFHEAIEMAVAQWRFEPAKLTRLEPTPNGPPMVNGFEETETQFDISFTFSPSGAVKSAPRK